MSWTYTAEYYKQYTKDTWNESAAHYGPIERNLNLWTPDLLAAAVPRAGERVLDVATGNGEPALTLAGLVAPKGEVLGIDLAENMLAVARQRAAERKLANTRFEVMDAEAMTLADGSYDLAVSRFGLQIVTDPDQTIAEMRRVLKPGGRLAVTVWGPGDRNPALHSMVGPMLEHAEPDETGYLPTPYEMGGEGELVAMLEKAGFVEVAEKRVHHDWWFRDEEEYFAGVLQGTPLGHSLREEDEAVQKEVLAATRKNLARWVGAKGITMPSEAVVVRGRKG